MASVFGSVGTTSSELQSQSQEIIQTGIPGFDDAIGQGLYSGTLYLITGSVGSNGTLLAQQILYNLMVRKKKVAYYTVEKPGIDVMHDMKVFGMDIEQYVDDGSWKFCRVIPPNLKKIFDIMPEYPMEQKIYLDNIDVLLNHFYEMVKDGRNTMIHLSSLVRNLSLEEIQNILFYITAVVRKHGGLHYLSLTEGIDSSNIVTLIKDLADSVFEVKSELRGIEMENVVTITKMRGVIPKTRVIRLSTREGGLATETVRRIQ